MTPSKKRRVAALALATRVAAAGASAASATVAAGDANALVANTGNAQTTCC